MAASKATKANPRPTSNAKLAERIDDLDERVRSIEKMIEDSKLAKQREYAKQLAADPEKLNALKGLVELAAQQGQ